MKRQILIKVIMVFAGYLFCAGIISAQEQDTLSPKPNDKKYVGIEKCKSCHPDKYKVYEERKFDKTWKVLVMRGETENPECFQCHTTGYKKPGGFVDEQTTPNLKYKQCEACHGPGSVHIADPQNENNRTELRNFIREKNVCVECHQGMNTHQSKKIF